LRLPTLRSAAVAAIDLETFERSWRAREAAITRPPQFPAILQSSREFDRKLRRDQIQSRGKPKDRQAEETGNGFQFRRGQRPRM
jgi:hypothetical protein